MKKKFFAVLMALCMVLSLGNITAYAADATLSAGEYTEEHLIALEAGDSDGYTYSYTVPSDVEGKVKVGVEVKEASGYYSMLVTNKTTYEEDAASSDSYGANDPVAAVNASAGDEVTIRVKAYGTWNNETLSMEYPALEKLTWIGTVGAVGTVDSPDEMVIEYYGSYQGGDVTTVSPGTDGYYYEAEAPVKGTFYMYLTSYATTATEPEIILTVGDKVAKYSESTETKTIMTGRMPEEVTVVAIEVEMFDVVEVQIKDNGTGTETVDIAWNVAVEEPLGTAGNPYDIESFETTVTIPAYTAVYFEAPYEYLAYAEAVYFEGTNTYVFVGNPYRGVVTPAEDGELVGFVDNLYYNYNGPIFGIMNNGAVEEECTITFDIPAGVYINPEVIEDEAEHTFVEDDGFYFYTWTAPADGIVTLSAESTSSWMFSVDNVTSGYYGSYYNSEEGGKEVIEVAAGDELLIYVSAFNSDWETVPGTVTTIVDFTESVGTVLDAEYVADVVTDIENGNFEDGVINVNLNEDGIVDETATVIPSDILAAVKEYNELVDDLDIIFWTEYYAWYIDGSSIESTLPIDLGLNLGSENIAKDRAEALADGNEWAQFSIAHDGDFGFDAVLEFFFDLEANPTFVGKQVVLYWDNNGTFVEIGKYTIDEDGIVGFAMSHASDYVMVVEGTAVVEPPVDPVDPPATGDATNFALWFAVLGLGVVAIAGSVVMKKREF